jgi:hypothetical protein
MADFDPKAFLAQGETEAFDPKAFLAQKPPAKPKYEPAEDTMYSPDGIPLVTPQSMGEGTAGGRFARDIMTDVVSAPIRAGMSLAKPVVGAAEWAGISAPSKAVLGIDKGIAEQTGPISTGASFAGDIYGFNKLGNLATKVAPAAMKVPAWLKPILGGAAVGAVQPTGKAMGEEGFLPEKSTDIGVGAALGPLAEKVVKGAGSVLSPQLQRLKELTAQGIDTSKLTLGQTLGGGAQKFENFLQAVPLGGVKPLVKSGRESLDEQFSAKKVNFENLLDQFKNKKVNEVNLAFDNAKFNLEKSGLNSTGKLDDYISLMREGLTKKHEDFSLPIFNKVLSNIGQQLPKGIKGNDAVDYVQKAVGTGYDDALQTIKSVNLTPNRMQEFNDILERAQAEFGDAAPDLFKQLKTDINTKILGNFANSTSIPSAKWHTIFKEIGDKSFGKRDASGFDRDYGKSLYEAQGVLKGMAEDADPTGAIKRVNAAHSELQIPQRAAGYLTAVKARSGAFTPEELLKASAKESSEKAFSAGNAPYQKLAKESLDRMQTEKTILENKIKSLSGTKSNKLDGLKEERATLIQKIGDLQSKLQKRVERKLEPLSATINEIKEQGKPMGAVAGAAPLTLPLVPALLRGLTKNEGAVIPNVVQQLGELGPAYYGLMAAPTVLTKLTYGNPLAQKALKAAATKRPEFMTQAGEAIKQQPNMGMLGGTEAVQAPVKNFMEQTQGLGQKEGGLVHLANGGQPFNPQSADYDYKTAQAYGMGPTGTGQNAGHWGSVAPTSDDERMLRGLPEKSYVMLKGKNHPTWNKAESAEKSRGSKIVKLGDRYYSIPE